MSRQYEATLTVRCGSCDTADSASMAATSGQEATAGAMMLLRYRGWRIGKGGKSVMDKDRCPACAGPLDPCIGCGQPLPNEYRARRWGAPSRHECAACDRQRARAARAASKAAADTSEQETEHRCEPYYSRSECGQCGWQEQWCVTCSRQMCGCATETTDQDAMGADQ